MKRSVFGLVTLALIMASSVGLAASAQAGTAGSQVPAAKQASSRDIARANAKSVLATELDAWSKGQISASTFGQDAAAFLAAWGPATFASQRLAGPLLTMPPSKSLPVVQYPEFGPQPYCHGYICYCGPSTAVTVLQYLQPTSHDGETLIANGSSWQGQFGLAGNFWSSQFPNPPYSGKYLETNLQGGETPWYSGGGDYPMPETFNYWISGNYWGSPGYEANRPTSVGDYESKLKADIWAGGPANSPGYPLAGAVEEVPGQIHLWGHPTSLDIQHWIVLYGYQSSGYYTSYADPAAGSPLNWPVSAYNPYWLSSDMYTLISDSHNGHGPGGIVW